MDIFVVLLYVAALLLLGLAAFEISSRINLLAAGLFCFVLAVAMPVFVAT